jgi:hypothetical protein
MSCELSNNSEETPHAGLELSLESDTDAAVVFLEQGDGPGPSTKTNFTCK